MKLYEWYFFTKSSAVKDPLKTSQQKIIGAYTWSIKLLSLSLGPNSSRFTIWIPFFFLLWILDKANCVIGLLSVNPAFVPTDSPGEHYDFFISSVIS